MAAATRAERGAWPVATGCVLAFAGLAVLAAQSQDSRLSKLDQALSTQVAARRTTAAVRVARAASAVAEPALAAIPLAACAAMASRRHGWPAGSMPCVIVLAGRPSAACCRRP